MAKPAPLKAAVKSVVSVYAGDGMGSGVVTSDEGYILTNHHVAGSSGDVRVRWPDGSDTVGEVVRGDRRRDVALIRTERRAAPLPIRPAPPEVGDDINFFIPIADALRALALQPAP